MSDKFSHGKCKKCDDLIYLKNDVCAKCEKMKVLLGETSYDAYKIGRNAAEDLQQIFGIKK